MSTHITLPLWGLATFAVAVWLIGAFLAYLALLLGRDQGEHDQQAWCEAHHLNFDEAITEPPADPDPEPSGFIGWPVIEDALAIAERQWYDQAGIEELTAEQAARTEHEIRRMTREAEQRIGPIS